MFFGQFQRDVLFVALPGGSSANLWVSSGLACPFGKRA